MAGDVRNVQVNLSANVSPYQQAMQNASKATNVALDSVTKLAKATDNLVRSAGKKIAFVGVADIAALTAMAEATNRLDVAMTQVRANSAVTGQSVGALRNQVINLSKSIPDSTNNLARLVGQIQALGVQGTANISNMTVTAERLAAATNTAPGELFSSLLQLNRQMGNGLQTLNNYSSSLVTLSKNYGVAASDISGFAQSISSVAQSAGYTETQILGMAAAFSRAGADSSAAANVFTTLTSEINQAVVTGSAQLKQFGDLVGQTSQGFAQMAKSNPAKAFTEVLSAIQHQGQAGILTLQQLGLDGPRALRVISALTGGQANLVQSMNMSTDAYSKNTALTKSSNAAWDDLSATMQKFRNNLDDIATRLGGPMAHALRIMFEGVNGVLEPLNTFLGYLGPIPGIVAGIGGAFLAVTGTITAFSVAILAAAGAWRALSGMTGTNALQGLVSGMRQPTGQGPFVNPRTIFRQRPIDMERRSGPANRIFSGAYAMGQRFSSPPPEDPNFAQRVMGRTTSIGRSIATYPFRRLGWEAREAADTLRPSALFNYENRDASKVNPVSLLGFMQQAQRGGSAARGAVGDIAGRLSTFLGSTRFGRGPNLKVNADTTAAFEKIEEIRKEASAPVTMPVRTTGGMPSGPAAFVRGGPGVAAGVEEEALAAGGRTGGMLSMLGRGVGGAVSAMGTLAEAVSSVALPMAILAPAGIALYHVLNNLHSSAQKAAMNMDDLGAALAHTAGATYQKPTETPPTPPSEQRPFGAQERTTATDSAFLSGNQQDISRLSQYQGGTGNRVRAAQLLINNVVQNANSGSPLNANEQTVLREQLIAAYGTTNARNIYGSLKFGGTTGTGLTKALLDSVKDDSGYFQDPYQGKGSSQQIMNAVTPIANNFVSNPAAAALGLIGINRALPGLPGGAPGGAGDAYYPSNGDMLAAQPNVQKFQQTISDLIGQLNKNQTGDNVIKVDTENMFNLRDFMNALQAGNQRAKNFAEALTKAGLNLDDLSGSVTNLTNKLKTGPTINPEQRAIDRTFIGRVAGAQGIDLSNPQNADYQSSLGFLTGKAMQQGRGNAPVSTINQGAIQNAIDMWRKYENTISTSSPAFQGVAAEIDALNQKLSAQQQIFQTAGQQASYYAQQAQSMIGQFGTSGQAGTTERQLMDQAQADAAQGEATLKGYVMQVHEAHIQMAQGQQDFNLQMSHMYRDFNIQQKEALYERNVQLKESNYQFMDQLRTLKFQTAQAFGNPAQMVQAQYTMGAQSALLGLKQQNQMLQDSTSTIDQLHRMGVSRSVIRVLGLDDPTNVEQAQRYLADFAQNPKLIEAFNKSIKGRLRISDGLNTDVNNSKFHDMQREFNHTANMATQAFNHSQEVTKEAFDRSLSDFTQQYQISVSREQQQLAEIGQNLYHNWGQLEKAAMATGLANIQKYARGVGRALDQLKRDNQSFIDSTQGGNVSGTSGGGQSHGRYWTNTTAQNRAFLWSELQQESGSYSAIGGGTGPGDRAMGAYQILASNIPGWSKEILGHSVTVSQFMHSPRLQDEIAQGKLLEYVHKYGLRGAASAWYSGNPTPANNDIRQYVNSVIARMAQAPKWLLELGKHFHDYRHHHHHHSGSSGQPPTVPLPPDPPHHHHHHHGRKPVVAPRYTHHHHHHKKRPNEPSRGSATFKGADDPGLSESDVEGGPFINQVLKTTMMKTGIPHTAYQMAKTSVNPTPVVFTGTVNNKWDHSTNFSGNWTIQAQDPNEMARKLEQKRRLSALTKPPRKR